LTDNEPVLEKEQEQEDPPFDHLIRTRSRVKDLNKQDYIKLVWIMNYFKATDGEIPKMSTNDCQTIKWYIDSSFAEHKDMRSHTGAIMTLGKVTTTDYLLMHSQEVQEKESFLYRE
jgi:hypothetical protein